MSGELPSNEQAMRHPERLNAHRLIHGAHHVVRNLRAWRGQPLWTLVAEITSHGSTYSMEICEDLGFNPHHKIGDSLERRPDEPVRPTPEPCPVEAKERARDVHYALIERFDLKDTPTANSIVRIMLERLAGLAQPPGEVLRLLAEIDEYLSRSPVEAIFAGSALHKKIKAACSGATKCAEGVSNA